MLKFVNFNQCFYNFKIFNNIFIKIKMTVYTNYNLNCVTPTQIINFMFCKVLSKTLQYINKLAIINLWTKYRLIKIFEK